MASASPFLLVSVRSDTSLRILHASFKGSLKRQHSIMYSKKMGRSNSVDSTGGGGAAGAGDDDDDDATTDDDADDAAAFGANDDDDDDDDDDAGAAQAKAPAKRKATVSAVPAAAKKAKAASKKQATTADSDSDSDADTDDDDDDGDGQPIDTTVTWLWAGDSDPVGNPGAQDTLVDYSECACDYDCPLARSFAVAVFAVSLMQVVCTRSSSSPHARIIYQRLSWQTL